MKNIFVLGSNSFSGASFVKYLLKKKYKVIAISRSAENPQYYLPYNKKDKNKKFFKLQIGRDTEKIIKLIRKYKPIYIINYGSQSMVGESWDKPEDWFKTNSLEIPILYKKIFDLNLIKKLVHISTPEVYGSDQNYLKENYNFNPSTPYAVSRTTADLYLKILFENFKFPFIILRASNVYGEYQRLYRIIPKAIDFFYQKKVIPLHGGGSSIRSFIHIDDVCEASYKALKKGISGNTYHISSDHYISIKKLLKEISRIMKVDYKKYVKNVSDRKGKDGFYKLNSSKIKKLGWKTKINLNSGIKRVISWYRINKKNFKDKDYIYIHKK